MDPVTINVMHYTRISGKQSGGIARLQRVAGKFEKPSDNSFAFSLIGQYSKKGNLSPAQWKCVKDLLDRQKKPQTETERVQSQTNEEWLSEYSS